MPLLNPPIPQPIPLTPDQQRDWETAMRHRDRRVESAYAAQAELARLRETVHASPAVVALRDRAARLNGALSDARDELGRATASADQLAGEVRTVALADLDALPAAEKARDSAAEAVRKLAMRVEDLAAAAAQAEQESADAEAKAVRVAARSRMGPARAESDRALDRLLKTRERHERELAAAMGERLDAQALAQALEDAATGGACT